MPRNRNPSERTGNEYYGMEYHGFSKPQATDQKFGADFTSTSTASDFSQRESAKPYGDQYSDMKEMIDSSVSSATGAFTTKTYVDTADLKENVQYFVPVTGATLTATNTSTCIIVNPAAGLAALTVVLPTTPVNGQRFTITSSQTVAAITLTGTFAANNTAPTALTAGQPIRYVYSTDAAKWFRA